MSSFITTPAAAETDPAATYVVGGFFTDIALGTIRDRVRIGEGVVTDARLINAVEGAVLTAHRSLADWLVAQLAAGVTSLENVIDPLGAMLDGKTRPVVLWQRIILYYTAAEIADTHRDITATDEGQIRGEEENRSADEYRRLAHNAVADLIAIRPADEDAAVYNPVNGQRNAVALI